MRSRLIVAQDRVEVLKHHLRLLHFIDDECVLVNKLSNMVLSRPMTSLQMEELGICITLLQVCNP
jgi:hypothetical protein